MHHWFLTVTVSKVDLWLPVVRNATFNRCWSWQRHSASGGMLQLQIITNDLHFPTAKIFHFNPNRSPIHQHNADDADVSSLTQCHILTPPMIHIVNGMWFMWNIFCSQRQPSSVCDVFWFKNSCDVTSIMITRWKSGLNREAEIYWRNSSGSQRNRWYSHQC